VRVEGPCVVCGVAHAGRIDVEDARDLARHIGVHEQLAEVQVAVDGHRCVFEVVAILAFGRDLPAHLRDALGIPRQSFGEAREVPVEPVEQGCPRRVDGGHRLQQGAEKLELIEERCVVSNEPDGGLGLDSG